MPSIYKNIFDEVPDSLDETHNPYVKKLRESRTLANLPVIYGSQLKGLSGRWVDLFHSFHPQAKKPEKIILEIGSHKGHVLSRLAKNFPDYGFIGMDITFKRVVLTAQRAKDENLTNVISVLGDARELLKIFKFGELDGVIAFFPDPWEKKRSQVSKKLFNFNFIQILRELICKNGFFWFKTDSKSYFNEVKQYTDTLKLETVADEHRPINHDYLSVFENMFISKNLPTYEGWWRR